MSTGPIKSRIDRLLEMAVALVAIALLVTWAWQLIRPLVPVVVAAALLYGAVRYAVYRSRNW